MALERFQDSSKEVREKTAEWFPEYKLVQESSAKRLGIAVNVLIYDGYEPQGGVAFRRKGLFSVWYCQAMVRLIHPSNG